MIRLTPEFPVGVDLAPGEVTRRDFMRLAAASAALAGLTGCTAPPPDPILPYVNMPSGPLDAPSYYATAMTIDGCATGLLVESRFGRPLKVEGNPDHPASLGAAGIFEQASLLQLYDPDRARAVRLGDRPSSWDAFRRAFAPAAIASLAGETGAGLRLLLEPTSSPLVAAQLAVLRARFPESRVYFHAPVSRRAVIDGARLATGQAVIPQLRLERADVIVALDHDLLGAGPFSLRYARHWADGRRLRGGSLSMNRLFVAEGMPTVTGTSADERVAVRPGEIALVAQALLAAVGGGAPAPELRPAVASWVRAAARDLAAARGRGVVTVGERQPAVTHALAHAVNAAAGNVGETVWFSPPVVLEAGEPSHSLAALVEEIRAGLVQTLVIIGGNPAYGSPPDLDVPGALARVPRSAYVGLYDNETARLAEWCVPEAHYLETWGDTRAYDGTASIVQPLVRPLYDGRTVSEVLAALAGDPAPVAYRLVREFWTGEGLDPDAWDEALRRGVIVGTALPLVDVRIDPEGWRAETVGPGAAGLELAVPIDDRVYDGRFSNNPWLQELPHPISKVAWAHAAYLSPATAAAAGVRTGDVVELAIEERQARAPAFVLEGVADDLVVLSLGYGRDGGELAAAGIGANAWRLLPREGDYIAAGVALRRVMTAGPDGPVPLRERLPTTQEHWEMEGRPIALAATLEQYRRDPDIADQRKELPTLYDPFPEDGVQWGMAIDLSVCTGCSACVVACQAENNIPVVGPVGVLEHREMHWLRIDRYADAGVGHGAIVQPMLCQHCEKAPCEYVCPVNATVHSNDGLNEMIYNRCVGTRFCSNNCPYKVRRFNWFDYTTDLPAVRQLAMNPEVTVRERGVMEKCTFCVQRIRRTSLEGRVGTGTAEGPEVVTACQQACPTRAIVFGPVSDPASEVAALRDEPRAYTVLHELGTRPRVHYLAKITNPADDGGDPA